MACDWERAAPIAGRRARLGAHVAVCALGCRFRAWSTCTLSCWPTPLLTSAKCRRRPPPGARPPRRRGPRRRRPPRCPCRARRRPPPPPPPRQPRAWQPRRLCRRRAPRPAARTARVPLWTLAAAGLPLPRRRRPPLSPCLPPAATCRSARPPATLRTAPRLAGGSRTTHGARQWRRCRRRPCSFPPRRSWASGRARCTPPRAAAPPPRRTMRASGTSCCTPRCWEAHLRSRRRHRCVLLLPSGAASPGPRPRLRVVRVFAARSLVLRAHARRPGCLQAPFAAPGYGLGGFPGQPPQPPQQQLPVLGGPPGGGFAAPLDPRRRPAEDAAQQDDAHKLEGGSRDALAGAGAPAFQGSCAFGNPCAGPAHLPARPVARAQAFCIRSKSP
jgi:hypothetical protein